MSSWEILLESYHWIFHPLQSPSEKLVLVASLVFTYQHMPRGFCIFWYALYCFGFETAAPYMPSIKSGEYYLLVGFGRACAPVRCAHPSFWAHAHCSFAAPPNIKSRLFPDTKIFPFWPELGPPGEYIFPLG
jgi:hypothetical protein